MVFPWLSSFPTCLPAGMPSDRRRPNQQGTPWPNSRQLRNSFMSILAIKHPPKGRRPAPRLRVPGGSSAGWAPGMGPPPSRLRDPRRVSQAPGSAPRRLPVPVCAGRAVLFEAGAGGRTRRCHPPREASGAGIRAAVLRPPVSQRGGGGTRPGRSRQKAARGVRAVNGAGEERRGKNAGGEKKKRKKKIKEASCVSSRLQEKAISRAAPSPPAGCDAASYRAALDVVFARSRRYGRGGGALPGAGAGTAGAWGGGQWGRADPAAAGLGAGGRQPAVGSLPPSRGA